MGPWSTGAPAANAARMSSCSGYLWKMKKRQRVLIPQWNKRFFSLEGQYLRWYEDSSATTPNGCADLATVDEVKANLNSGPGIYSFSVSYPLRVLVLRANDIQEMKKWIRIIKFQADLARGGAGTGILCKPVPDITSPSCKKNRSTGRSLEDQLDRTLLELDALERKIILGEGEKNSQPYGTESSQQIQRVSSRDLSFQKTSKFDDSQQRGSSRSSPRTRSEETPLTHTHTSMTATEGKGLFMRNKSKEDEDEDNVRSFRVAFDDGSGYVESEQSNQTRNENSECGVSRKSNSTGYSAPAAKYAVDSDSDEGEQGPAVSVRRPHLHQPHPRDDSTHQQGTGTPLFEEESAKSKSLSQRRIPGGRKSQPMNPPPASFRSGPPVTVTGELF